MSSAECSTPRVVVIGGGLAGMAAAVALESAGILVTLIEARRVLGGRAGSFQEPQSGEILDNCQHVLLGCCTNLIDFYRRISSLDLIRFERTIRFAAPDGRQWGLTGVRGLPAPLHLGPAMARFSLLSLRERLELMGAMLAILRISAEEFSDLADVSFGQWLDEHGQSPELVRKLYDPIVVSGLNEETRSSAASHAIKIFRDSLLVNRGGYLFGLPTAPLSCLYERLALRDMRLSTRLAEICFDGGRAQAVRLQDQTTIPCDAMVLATNFHTVRDWIPPELLAADSRFNSLDSLQSVPILGAHLWFDGPVLATSHLALVEGPLQWLFRKDETACAVHGVISAARDWVGVPREKCLELFEKQICALLPKSEKRKLVRGVMVIEKRATFSPVPGVERLRPRQVPPPGGIGNLFLAGDYTQTQWPATMEGAVRSGYLAADGVLKLLHVDHPGYCVADLPLEWPARSMRHFSMGRTTSRAER